MPYITIFAAFLSVLALIGVGAYTLKWIQNRLGKRLGWQPTTISVTETFYIDAKRRLVCAQHGKRHYFLLLGPHNDIVLDHWEDA